MAKALAGVLFALCCILGFHNYRFRGDVERLEHQAYAASLNAENQIALANLTFLESGLWQKRAEQYQIQRDSLAERLDQRPVVETVVTVEVPGDTVYAEAVSQDSVVSAQFDDSVLTAEVKYRPAPMTMSLDYQIKPITLNIGVRCAPRDTVSFANPAIITVEDGENMTFTVEEGVIDPEVCNPAPVKRTGSGFNLKSALLGSAATLSILLIGR
jgi:hypothetical protein